MANAESADVISANVNQRTSTLRPSNNYTLNVTTVAAGRPQAEAKKITMTTGHKAGGRQQGWRQAEPKKITMAAGNKNGGRQNQRKQR